MIRPAFAFAALGAALAFASDESPGGVSVGVESPRTTYYVGERFRLTLRFGFDETWFRDHAIQMFRRPLGVPVQIGAPWMKGVPGALEVVVDPSVASAGERRTVALDDSVETAASNAGSLLLTRRFVARRAGPLTLAAPTARFEYSQQFDEDLVQGRVPLDRKSANVEGAPLALTILDLPRDGRPATFSGGIGRFSLSATADRTEVAHGEHLTLRLTIRADDGNLDALDPPRLDALPGFHVFGVLDDKGAVTRTVQYELAPLTSHVREIPPIELAYFDPTPPAAYRTTATPATPLTVTGRPGDLPAPASAPPPSAPESSTNGAVPIVVVLLGAIAAVLIARRRRDARRVVIDPATERALGAAATFRSAVAANPADAFAAYLAARLGCAEAAVIAPDLPQRLTAAGVPRDLAARTSSLVERLVAARYGGGADPAAADEARALVVELEREFGHASASEARR